jgi:hypothetical protein
MGACILDSDRYLRRHVFKKRHFRFWKGIFRKTCQR